MAGELKLEIVFREAIYVLDRMGCARMLIFLEHEEPEIGAVMVSLREDLRKALLGFERAETAPNPFEDDGDEQEAPAPYEVPAGTLKSVAAENKAECGDCRKPRCRFCDLPGKMIGGRKDGLGRMVERYYVCETEGCIASKMKTPQPARLFTGGQ